MSQLKKQAIIITVGQIQQQTYQCKQLQIKEKHEQQFYYKVMGFIDQYLQSKEYFSNSIKVLKEINICAESKVLNLIEKQTLLQI